MTIGGRMTKIRWTAKMTMRRAMCGRRRNGYLLERGHGRTWSGGEQWVVVGVEPTVVAPSPSMGVTRVTRDFARAPLDLDESKASGAENEPPPPSLMAPASAHEQSRRRRSAAAVQLDDDDESDCLPIVGVAHDQIGHYGQSASLIVVTITTRPTVHRKPPSGGSQPVAYNT